MPCSVETVVIAGLGLIGGSLARALRISGFSRRLIAYGHREPSLRRGRELGVIDGYTLDMEDVIDQADMIVLCAPTLASEQLLRDILPRLAGRDKAPVLTDVASVKGNLRDTAIAVHGSMPAKLILAHPIAGSERSGVDAADAGLFVDHRVILTPEQGNDTAALELVRAMWRSTGAEVVEMPVDRHDEVLAATSHLPHVLAYTLVDALAGSDSSGDIFRFAAGGFRDFTRIASSDPTMWSDIAIANASALLAAIDSFSEHLNGLRSAVARGDRKQLLELFARAKLARDEFARLSAPQKTQAGRAPR